MALILGTASATGTTSTVGKEDKILTDGSGRLLAALTAGGTALSVDGSGNLKVTDAVLRAGEDQANDWRKVKTAAILTYSPAKTSGTAVGAAATDVTILASVEVLGYKSVRVSTKPTGTGGLVNVDVMGSPDGTSWEIINTNAAIATGVLESYGWGDNSYRYVMARADGDGANATTVDCWLTCNA